jgi:hypothetical protein
MSPERWQQIKTLLEEALEIRRTTNRFLIESAPMILRCTTARVASSSNDDVRSSFLHSAIPLAPDRRQQTRRVRMQTLIGSGNAEKSIKAMTLGWAAMSQLGSSR